MHKTFVKNGTLLLFLLFCINLNADSTEIRFTPPKGWHFADNSNLPSSVKIMVVGKGQKEFPPSLNLATEQYPGTLKEYLQRIKAISDSQGGKWSDLGSIQTAAGEASLSQTDSKTAWGEIRMLHAILLEKGTIYILTASSLKDEFSQFYKDFFASLRSLEFVAQTGDTK